MRWAREELSLIIFLLQYNLQLFSLFDFYSPRREGGRGRGRYTDLSLICTGWQAAPADASARFQLIKLRPTHWAICFLWPPGCAASAIAVLAVFWLRQSVIHIIIECCLRCYSWSLLAEGVKMFLIFVFFFLVARRHYYYCFYRYSPAHSPPPLSLFVVCGSLRSFERENGFVFYDLIIMTAFDYKYYTAWNASSSFLFFLSLSFFYAAYWSCKWFWLRFLVSLVFLTSFWQFGLLMFINETSSSALLCKYKYYTHQVQQAI